MRQHLFKAVMAASVLAGIVTLHPTEVFAQASATNGSLRGVLKDQSNGDAAVGATVVATSPSLQGEQVVITDENGQYFITSLPPGLYVLTVYYNNNTFSRGNVLIQVGKEAVVNMTVNSAPVDAAGKAKGEVIEITGNTPIIDQGSTKTGVTITTDYTNNIPTGRTFGAVLGAASGSQGDFYGTSIGGATSVENTYIVEGINTTDTAFGQLSSNLPNEFVQETEVITGGYNAEYGRATGGIVNVVTKQGSNEFHGTVFGYYSPGSFSAQAKTIQHEGSSIDVHTDLDYAYDVGGEVGGPIIKDKLWFHVGFNPSSTHEVTTRLVQSQVDNNQDGIPDVDPNTGFTIHAPVSQSSIPERRTTYFFTAKINGAIDQNNQFQLSAFGNPRTGQIDDFGSALTFAPGNNIFNNNDGAYDFSAKYTSKLNDGKTQIDAVAGFHRGYSDTTAANDQERDALTFYNYTRPLLDFQDLEGAAALSPTLGGSQKNTCNDMDPNNPYPKLAAAGQSCPVFQYAESGLGLLENRTNDRTSAIVSVTQRVKALGYHTFKAGADLEESTYVSDQGFTGGEELRRSAAGRWRDSRYDAVVRNLTPAEIAQEMANPGSVQVGPDQQIDGCEGGLAICGVVNARHLDTSDRSIGAYAQDSWQIIPNLTVNAGIRYEQQALNNSAHLVGTTQPDGQIIPATAFTLNNWAPRIGAVYDPTAEGKSKIFAHWGRFFENIPMDINVRSFGGEIDNIGNLNQNLRQPGDPMYNPNCNVDHTPGVHPSTLLNQCNDFTQTAFFGGSPELVAPNMSGQHIDEFELGAEYEPINDLKVGITYQHRSIADVIEDMSTDGANTYIIANPGKNYDADAAALAQQAAGLMASNPLLAAALKQEATTLGLLKEYDPPSRDYDSVALRVEQRPTKQSLLIASYTYSVEKGNYPGLFSTETNQLDPNITSLYDLPDLMANRYGPLGLDRPHNVKLDGFYRFDLKEAGLITTGASIRGQSGIAHNALAAHPTYGDGEAYLLPRGSIGRSPFSSEFDVHISYGRRLNKSTIVEAFADIFNLFNQQDELNVDENYTFSTSVPVVGGDKGDLAHVKAHDGGPFGGIQQNTTVIPNKNFDNTNALTAPRSFRFGVRLTF